MRSRVELRKYLTLVMSEDEYLRLLDACHKTHEDRKGGMVMNSFCVCGWHNQFSNNILCHLMDSFAEYIKENNKNKEN